MELTMTNGFCELTMDEMQVVDGGSKEAAQAVLVVGGTVLCGAAAPVIWAVAGTAAFATAYIAGVGLIGSALFI